MIITTSERHKSKQKLALAVFYSTYLGLIETDPSSHLTEGACIKTQAKIKTATLLQRIYTYRKGERKKRGWATQQQAVASSLASQSLCQQLALFFYSLKNMGNAISDRKRNHRGIKRV
jgi:hypothetical protein